MFKAGGKYIGLDDFFYTKEEGHYRSDASIEERIAELDSIYKDWKYKAWKFSEDKVTRDAYNARFRDSLGSLRDGAISYIMGIFDASLLSSSTSVEMILRMIGNLTGRIDQVKISKEKVGKIVIQKTPAEEQLFARVKGRYARIFKIEEDDEFYLYNDYPSLKDLISMASEIGITVDTLTEGVDDDFTDSIFVVRRNEVSHAKRDTFAVVEQLHSISAEEENDEITYVLSHRLEALDQYSRACSFFIEVVKWFDSYLGYY